MINFAVYEENLKKDGGCANFVVSFDGYRAAVRGLW